MTLNFLVAPDFAPERFAGWHMLNTLLQSRSGLHLHLMMPATAHEQAELLEREKVDIVYANPFDAARMIRELRYTAFARPKAKPDEMVIAAGANAPVRRVEDLKPGCRIALTDNRDVKLIGLRLLEPADLTEADIRWQLQETFQACARLAIKGEVDAAFFLADTYHSLSRITRSQLHTVIESRLADITHVLLAHERIAADVPRVRDALAGIGAAAGDRDVLDALGIGAGFEPMDAEDAEFMVDLMDTLLD